MNPYLFPSLDKGPIVIARLIELMPSERIDRPTHADRFSPREVVAHLADWEPILLGRMQRALEATGTTIDGIDEGARAVELAYASSNLEHQLALYAEARRRTIQWLESLEETDWDKFVVHSERGRQSISDQANLLLGHDLYHVEQLSEGLIERAVGTW